jgi:DNA-binding transcriptional MerR regulator
MNIGELARRLRVTPRTLRHYEQLGLLRPESIDHRTGYRAYGPQQLLLGVQIEQLKAAGLSLAAIGEVTEGGASEAILLERRAEVTTLLARHRAQLATIDALLGARAALAEPRVVQAPAFPAVIVRAMSEPDELGPTIRRTVQRLRRSVHGDGRARCRSFSARFPLELVDGPVSVEVAAHVDVAAPPAVTVPSQQLLTVELAGPVSLLPLAYDALLDVGRDRGLPLGDTVIEHYLDLGTVGRTEVAIPVRTALRAR